MYGRVLLFHLEACMTEHYPLTSFCNKVFGLGNQPILDNVMYHESIS